MLDDKGSFVGFRGVGSDVTEQRESDEKIAYLARYDTLTGLPNRIEMMEKLEDFLDEKVDTTVMLIGLDGLKKINDDLGYKVGDTILQSLAIRLPPLVSKETLMCRPEGSMFGLILPGMGDPVRAMAIAHELLHTVNSPLSVGEHVVRLCTEAELPAVGEVLQECRKVYQHRQEQRERDAIAREIRRLVAISGLTQRQFASQIGTSPSRLSTYVNGRVVPSAAMLLRN